MEAPSPMTEPMVLQGPEESELLPVGQICLLETMLRVTAPAEVPSLPPTWPLHRMGVVYALSYTCADKS